MNLFRHSIGSPLPIVLAALALTVLACSSGPTESNAPADAAPSGDAAPTTNPTQSDLQAAFDTLPAGDAARGEQIFNAQPCHVCHVDAAIGPAFPGDPALATATADRKSGYSAELYLYESIVDPSAYVVSGYPDGVMPATMSHTLSDQDIADLIAYLMTLK